MVLKRQYIDKDNGILNKCIFCPKQTPVTPVDTGGKFATGVVDTGDALDLRILEKKLNRS
jgi:hypothetical protein